MQRRRFIQILASSTASISLGHNRLLASSLKPVHWQGYALGATGQVTLYTDQPSATQKVLQHCLAEIRRLESLFSLYDHQSELCRLNRDGYLNNPSKEWQPLLSAIEQAYQTTDGLFDPTVQRLWKAYEKQFARPGPQTQGLSGAALVEARACTGWKQVEYNSKVIRFQNRGMQMTLNGIAQGFITDQISQLLQDAGYSQVLIELGETRALGKHPEGRPWQIGIEQAGQRKAIFEVAELDNQALATSGSYGSTFSQDGRYHHLIHPRTGLPATQWISLSVIAPTATEADALSTGLSFANSEIVHKVVRDRPSVKIIPQT